MSTKQRTAFAYQVEIRDSEKSEWKHLDIMVSLPGEAPRQVIDSVKVGKENLVRTQRIKNSVVFCERVTAGYAVATQNECYMMPLLFEDATMEPLN